MGDAQFQTLLDALPQIAEHVEKFDSEAVQLQVVEGLLTALMGPSAPEAPAAVEPDVESDEPLVDTVEPAAAPSSNGQTKVAQPKKKKGKSLPKIETVDFDWAPEGKESLLDFVERKQPKTNVDRNLSIIFYLEQVAKQNPITVGHIVSGFYACSWNVPAYPNSALSQAASLTKGIDTSSLNNIAMTHIGRNIVNNQLPRAAKSKS